MSRTSGCGNPTKAALLVVVLSLPAGVSGALAAGDAGRGPALLESKGCLECHSLLGAGGGTAPDLGERAPDRLSPAGMAAALWNHDVFAPDSGEPSPRLSRGDAEHLYAYFRSLRLFDPPGDAVKGKGVFGRQCQQCHLGEAAAKAGEPSGWRAPADLAALGERLWNHAPGMSQALKEKSEPWPRLELQQAADLLAYLQGLASGSGADDRPRQGERQGDAARGRQAYEALGCGRCHSFGPAASAKLDLLRAVRREPSAGGLAVAMVNDWPPMAEAAADLGLGTWSLRPGVMADLVAYLDAQGLQSEHGNRARGEHLFRLKGCLGCHGMPRSGAPELKGDGRRHSAFGMAAASWRHAERAGSVRSAIPVSGGWPKLAGREISDLIAFLNGE